MAAGKKVVDKGTWECQTQGQPCREELPSNCTLSINCSLLTKARGRDKASWHHKEREVTEPHSTFRQTAITATQNRRPPSAVSRYSQNFPVYWKKKHLLRNIYPGKYIHTEVITLNALIPSITDCLDRNGAGCKKRSEDTGLKEGLQAR